MASLGLAVTYVSPWVTQALRSRGLRVSLLNCSRMGRGAHQVPEREMPALRIHAAFGSKDEGDGAGSSQLQVLFDLPAESASSLPSKADVDDWGVASIAVLLGDSKTFARSQGPAYHACLSDSVGEAEGGRKPGHGPGAGHGRG